MFGHILVPLDGSALAEQIVPLVCALAERCGSRITLLHLLERNARPTVHADRHLTRSDEAEEYLTDLAEHLSIDDRVDWHLHSERLSDVGRGIVQHAAELDADLIAITTHGSGGLSRFLFGSIAQQVLARCKQPILLLQSRPQGLTTTRIEGLFSHFLVPLNLEPAHDLAVEAAIGLARVTGARVKLLAVAETAETLPRKRALIAKLQPSASQFLLTAEPALLARRLGHFQRGAARHGVHAEAAIATGDPAARILAEIEQHPPGLVALASHRRHGLDAVMRGSVGQQVVNRSRTPLLIVPV
jgi:nucleotide-binding universal stress UspA family protein